jgi:nitrite reductase/ring-hydroxylating ferredoxin subunit
MKFFVNLLINLLKFLRPQVDADPGRVYVGKVVAFPPGQPKEVTVNGASVLVTRVGDDFCAVENRCAHLPVPLEGGRVEDGCIICPLHNSRFDLCTGANLDWTPGVAGVRVPGWSQQLINMGQEPRNITAYRVTVEGSDVFVDVAVRSE